MDKFVFPNAGNRVSIVGATGSGKTRFGIWLYSFVPFKSRPYIIFDFKGDDLIAQIPYAHEIDMTKIPKHPGLYIVRPTPHEVDAVDDFLWKIWEKENIGMFVDEGYMIGARSAPFNALLTQGRSKKIPMYICTQRPSYCSRFIFSEASYYACFRMQDARDYQIIQGFTPFDFSQTLPNYTARWYDVSRNWNAVIEPVPGDDGILERYERALKPKQRSI